MKKEFTQHDFKRTFESIDDIANIVYILELFCKENKYEEVVCYVFSLVKQIKKLCDDLYCFMAEFDGN